MEKLGKVLAYPSGADFHALLCWHAETGTRPQGEPDRFGVPWDNEALADAILKLGPKKVVDPKTAEGWLDRGNKPFQVNFASLVKVIFGENSAYEAWRIDFHQAYQRYPARGRLRDQDRETWEDARASPRNGDRQSRPPGLSPVGGITSAASENVAVITSRLTDHFFGREGDLKVIDDFVESRRACENAGLMVIAAPAGFGKSAVAAEWCRRAAERSRMRVARHFCATSAGEVTTDPGTVYAHLRQQVAGALGQDSRHPGDLDALVDLLGRTPPGDLQLVLWLDGLDEATGTINCFLPRKLGQRICVIVSARGEESDVPDHLAPWLSGTMALWHTAVRRTLLKLPSDDVQQLVDGIFAAAGLPPVPDLARRIFHASDGGHTLFVRAMAEGAVEEVKVGRPIDLGDAPESLVGYAASELRRLERLDRWPDLQPIFAVLTIAREALRVDELPRLTGRQALPRSFHRWATFEGAATTMDGRGILTWGYASGPTSGTGLGGGGATADQADGAVNVRSAA